MAFLDVSRRIIKFLLNTAQKESKMTENGLIKIKKITHKELASCTGASREAVTKALKILKFRGILIEKTNFYLFQKILNSSSIQLKRKVHYGKKQRIF